MRRISYGLIYLLTFCILLAGCASFRSADLNPQIKSGQLVQKMDNLIVLFDKSASMGELHGKPMVNEATRLIHAKETTKNMIATIPEIKLNAGLRTFWAEETALIYGMKSLVKEDYTGAINSIESPYGGTDIGTAITAAGNDLKSADGSSAIVIVSDFSDLPGIDDLRPAIVLDAITKVNEEYGDKLCVYAIQVGYSRDGKELSEQIVQKVMGGYTVNADTLATPAAMAAFVEKVISGDCSHYQQMFAKPEETVAIVAADPKVEEKVAAAVSETKPEEKTVAAVSEPKAEEKVIVLVFEDVHFDFDKSTLRPEAQTILKRNIQILKDNPKAKVRIAGYASASGTDAYNQKLSERRAKAVQEYLMNEGTIAQDRLSTIGYGETKPAMYEAEPKEIRSKAAKANMRVVFEILVQ
ncbi:MAG: OmpA family protein [Deltaproteobacteria bacterium]|nr:OmpA family protein [Deltaproteobacteria bacterium]